MVGASKPEAPEIAAEAEHGLAAPEIAAEAADGLADSVLESCTGCVLRD